MSQSPRLQTFEEVFKYPKFSKYLKYSTYIEYLNTKFKHFFAQFDI